MSPAAGVAAAAAAAAGCGGGGGAGADGVELLAVGAGALERRFPGA